MPSDLYSRLLLSICFILISLTHVQSQEGCDLPSTGQIASFIEAAILSVGAEGASLSVSLIHHHYTCQAVVALDRFKSVSIAVQYTRSDTGQTEYTRQLQLKCINANFNLSDVGTPLEIPGNAEILTISTRIDCRVCVALQTEATNNDMVANCIGKQKTHTYKPSHVEVSCTVSLL